jgi:hypothetical protein
VAPTPDTGSHSADEGSQQPDPPSGDGLPEALPDQRCAFCGGADVAWLHPLSTDRVQFRRFGKNTTPQSFWALCESCEQLYQGGEDDQLIALMRSAGQCVWQGTVVEDVLRKPVDVFREADLGRRAIGTA